MIINAILNIVTLGLKPVYEKHLEYKIIEEFRNKLPRPQNEAKAFTEEEKNKHPVLSELKDFTVLDLATHKMSVSEADIDLFYNRLNNFDFRFMLFKDYYKKYTANLNRFHPKAENKDFNLVMIQQVLKNTSIKPIRPLDVLIFQLKWQIKLTSKPYTWLLQRKKR
jgi:hypothetical protein